MPLYEIVKADGSREKVEHEASEACWCQPILEYRDPVTLAEVWVHRECTA